MDCIILKSRCDYTLTLMIWRPPLTYFIQLLGWKTMKYGAIFISLSFWWTSIKHIGKWPFNVILYSLTTYLHPELLCQTRLIHMDTGSRNFLIHLVMDHSFIVPLFTQVRIYFTSIICIEAMKAINGMDLSSPTFIFITNYSLRIWRESLTAQRYLYAY